MSRPAGFTLVELAVAMVIIGLLLAAAMIPLTTQVELRNAADTRHTLDQIKDAVIGFAQVNGRLPCPANGAIAAGASNAGVEAVSAVAGNPCTASFGVIPWSTLGVQESDAWGRRFSYRVSPAFADTNAALTWATSTTTSPVSLALQSPNCIPSPTPSTPASFALCTLGDLAVLNPTDTIKAPTTAVSTGVPAIIISHGKNGYGAYQSNGIQIAGTSGSHEAANNSGGADSSTLAGLILPYRSWVYYTRGSMPATSGCSDTAAGVPLCEFDDIVVWISPSTLVARMVSAGRLP
jgi:prepilin-type N-terminal cleavage/methylation domain-containing protein